jgi:translation initiation factor 1A
MPKNKGKGGKARRRGKNENETQKRELILKEDGQEYGQVVKKLGDNRLEVYSFDGKTRQCKIRGKMIRKVWVNPGDIVLISIRDFEEDKGDILHKYLPSEVQDLKNNGHLPKKGMIEVEDNENDEDDIGFTFDEI